MVLFSLAGPGPDFSAAECDPGRDIPMSWHDNVRTRDIPATWHCLTPASAGWHQSQSHHFTTTVKIFIHLQTPIRQPLDPRTAWGQNVCVMTCNYTEINRFIMWALWRFNNEVTLHSSADSGQDSRLCCNSYLEQTLKQTEWGWASDREDEDRNIKCLYH